jgi:hypothetical protein
MKYFLLSTFLLAFSGLSAQKLILKQKLKIAINGKADSNFHVKYLDPIKDVKIEKQHETYDATTNAIISYQNSKKPDWDKAKKLDSNNRDPNLPVLLKKDAVYIADIKPEEGRLMLYFWPFRKNGNKKMKNTASENTDVNKFIEDHLFSITMPQRTTLSFHSASWHVGVMTVPLKIYVGSPDSVSAVQSSFNAGLFFGRRWGYTKYVNLPNQKEISTYQTSWSVNIFAGPAKVDLDENNTSDKGKSFKGGVAVLSYGIMAAYHYKNFSVFLSFGDDKPFVDQADTWLLKKKPWLGIGFGFDIL